MGIIPNAVTPPFGRQGGMADYKTYEKISSQSISVWQNGRTFGISLSNLVTGSLTI
jgi:hypothetical protein